MTDDGNLPAARKRLELAIAALIDPKMQWTGTETRTAPSLYQQLEDSLGGLTGERSGGSGSLPLWPDCFDLKREIDETTARIRKHGTDTIDRLTQLAEVPWRPQDTRHLEQVAGTLEGWATAITALLYPEQRWTLPNPCPACGTRIVYRRTGGEEIRHPALQIGARGCECLKCHAVWGPDLFAHLARVLGYNPADHGVLE